MQALRLLGLILAGLLLTGIWQALTQGPPGVPAVPAPDDYPLAAKLRWTYSAQRGPLRLQRETEAGADGWVVMNFLCGPFHRQLEMRRTGAGIVGRLAGHEQLILKFPMTPGDSWSMDFPAHPETADCTVAGSEEIDVLGERRRATKLRVLRKDRGGRVVSEDFEWYAPGYGLVKTVFTESIAGIPLRPTFTLSSFERLP